MSSGGGAGQEASAANSGYNSGDETSSLLGKGAGKGPAPTVKPVLMRQECTTTLSVHPTKNQEAPALSTSAGIMGGSDDSAGGPPIIHEESARSVPDIELHCRLTGEQVSRTRPGMMGGRMIISNAGGLCHCDRERRKSQSMARSVSRESVRSGHPPPPLLLTTSPSSRIIRQSSQPEQCCHHHTATPSASLRQLREPGDGIAMIAADSLRINGAIRQFKQMHPVESTQPGVEYYFVTTETLRFVIS